MPDPYQEFSATQFARSTTPPTPFSAASAGAAPAPTAFAATQFAPSTTAPSTFGAGVLADLAALRAVPTPTLPLSDLRRVTSATPGEIVRAYQLEAGTTADNGDTVIRPADYAAGTNERIWRRTL